MKWWQVVCIVIIIAIIGFQVGYRLNDSLNSNLTSASKKALHTAKIAILYAQVLSDVLVKNHGYTESQVDYILKEALREYTKGQASPPAKNSANRQRLEAFGI